MIISSKSRRAWVAALTVLSASSAAWAASEVWDVDVNPTNGFGGVTPIWSLTDPDSAFAEWNVFDSYPIDATPDVGSFGIDLTSVTETTGGAFLTGGGNIYSFSVATAFTTVLDGTSSGSGGSRVVALRLENLGSALDPASVMLSVGGQSYAPTSNQLLYSAGSAFGAEAERLVVWNAVPNGVYNFTFNASASSMSLSKLAQYYGPATAPEPGLLLLLASGLAGLAVTRRRV